MVTDLSHIIFGEGVNSTNRLSVILRETKHFEARKFWPVFLDGWSSCDNTWVTQDELLRVLSRHHQETPARDFLNETDKEFFDSLPDTITVYRGCSRRRIRGVSWTTGKNVATVFANGHRGIRVPNAIIANGSILKSQIFFATQEREEFEIILDPYHVTNISFEPLR